MTISRTLYNKLCQLFREPKKVQFNNRLTKEIKEVTGFGHVIRIPPKRRGSQAKYHFVIKSDELEVLRQYILTLTELDIAKDEYIIGDRKENTKYNNDEKCGANASQDVILLNNSAGEFKLNGEIRFLFDSMVCSGIGIRHNTIQSIEHNAIIICENFTPMYYLSELKDNPIFTNALVVYRGDSQHGQRADQVTRFIQRFRGQLPLYYFGDLDPKGLNIAQDDFAVDGIILPCINALSALDALQIKSLAGKNKYFNQLKNGNSHVNVHNYPASWRQHIELINRYQVGLQQEHLLNKSINWQLYT